MSRFVEKPAPPVAEELMRAYRRHPVVDTTPYRGVEQILEQLADLPLGVSSNKPTDLCRMVFEDLPYTNLEDPEIRAYASEDANGFLADFPRGAVIEKRLFS